MTTEEESYARGHRAAFRYMLSMLLREFDINTADEDKLKVSLANMIAERQQAIAGLRELCEDFGDNEWEDNLHLADIIEKHLASYLWEGDN